MLLNVVADLSRLPKRIFWTFMDNRNWLHPFDAAGCRRSRRHLPETLADMIDDPYRSLAGELRRAGGFAKDTTPYSEFLWADFLRPRIGAKMLEADFETAIAKAIDLSHGNEASYLPGWCGAAD